ncbi:MAG TPA: ABC transporter substrate-binding protein [Anaerolineae bacterium]|nr:ABC transporter substrate-binding protein [Anaerolineae bacterium]
MKKLVLILITVTLIALSGCSGAGSATPTTPASPTKVTLAMGFIPNVQFAPFYVAVNEGYFADENLEIEFDYGMETDLLNLVGTDALQFAVASGDQVVLARGQGLPVVYVMTYFQRFPVAVVSLEDVPLSTPEDLVGRSVGIPGLWGASYIGWLALLDAAGIDEGDVKLESIGYTQVASLTEGQVEAAVVYAANEPVQLRQAGYEPNIIYIADYMNLVSNGIITNEKTIAERPELVGALVRAALRGLQYTIDHPEETFEICLEYVPEAGGDNRDVQMAVLKESIKFWQSDTLGQSDGAAWEMSQDFMLQAGLAETKTDTDKMYTNDFIVVP